MATTLTPPSAGISEGTGASDPGDISTELGQTLMSGVPDTVSEEAPPGEGGTEPTEYIPSQEETPPGEGPTANTETGLTTTNHPFPLSEDGKSYLVPTQQFADYRGLQEYSTAVQNRFPTVADAETAHAMSSDFRAMQYDYASGDPASIDRALAFWAGQNAQDPRMRQRYEAAFPVMAERATQFLQRMNPQAHQKLSQGLAQAFVEKAYQTAAMEADPKIQAEMFRNAQATDYSINGTYKQELPKYDPNAQASRAQQEAEQARLRGIEQRENQLMERDFNSFNQSALDGPKIAEVYKAIDEVLAPVKAKYDDADYGELREAVASDLTRKLKSDQDWWANHIQEYADLKREFEFCWKNRQDPSSLNSRAQYYRNDLLVRARRVLPSLAAPRISKATARKVAVATSPKTAAARPSAQAASQSASATASKTNGNQPYNLREDPEYTSMFKFR